MNFQAAGVVQNWQGYWVVIPVPGSEKLTMNMETGRVQRIPSECRMQDCYPFYHQAEMAVLAWMRRN